MSNPIHRRWYAGATALALTAAAVAGVQVANAAGQGSLPVTVVNKTGSNKPVYLYVMVTDLTTGKETLGYINKQGSFQAWPATASKKPQAAPDVAMLGPKHGTAMTIKLPTNVSGRLYYAVGHKMPFGLVGTDAGTGLVQPAPWVKGDKSAPLTFDWTEFTLKGKGATASDLWINSTQVDQISVPAVVTTKQADGTVKSTGKQLPGAKEKLVKTLRQDPRWAKTVVTDSNGKVLRVLSPGHATAAGRLDPTYLDSYITKAWSAYRTKTLTIQPKDDQPNLRFYGRTGADGLMTFTDGSGKVVARFAKPKSVDAWGCDGALNGYGNKALPNDQTTGLIGRSLCAGLNRGTLGTSSVEPVKDPSKFYRNTDGLNLYAKTVHETMQDQRAYAFAFDDVGGKESLVHAVKPTGVTITIGG